MPKTLDFSHRTFTAPAATNVWRRISHRHRRASPDASADFPTRPVSSPTGRVISLWDSLLAAFLRAPVLFTPHTEHADNATALGETLWLPIRSSKPKT